MSETSTRILIVLDLNYEDDEYIAELYDVEAAFLHPNPEVKMYIEWPEGILDLGIISGDFLKEYCIFLAKLMYINIDAVLLWLILLTNT